MAYREFQNEKIYEAPDVGDLPRTLDAIKFLAQQRERQQQRKFNAANDVKAYHQTNKIPKLQRAFGERIGQNTQQAFNDIYNGGVMSEGTRQDLIKTEQLDKRAIALEKALELRNQKIQEIAQDDPYFIKQHELEKNTNLIAENANESPDLEEKIGAMEGQINNMQLYSPEEVRKNFDQPKYIADYITKNFPYKEGENNVEGANGIKNKTSTSSRFWNNGKPEISDAQVIDFIGSHQQLKPWYAEKAHDELRNEVEQYRDLYPKDLTDDQIVTSLMEHPELNKNPNAFIKDNQGNSRPIDFGERIRNIAREDLNHHNVISNKLDYSRVNYNPSSAYNTRKNVNVSHGFDNSGAFNSPDLTFSNNDKNNAPLNLRLKPKTLINVENGKAFRNISDMEFNGRRVKVVLIDKNGQPIPIKGNSIEDVKKVVDELPLDTFRGARTKFAIEGTAVNKKDVANVLDKLRSGIQTPETQALIDKLSNMTEGTILDGSEQALIQKETGLNIVTPYIIPFDNNDTTDQELENATKGDGQIGFKAYRDAKGEMKEVYDYINNKIKTSAPKAQEEHRKMVQEKTVQKEKNIEEITKGKNIIPLKKSYKIGNVDYSLDDLKQMGYTEDQLRSAEKAGTIK